MKNSIRFVLDHKITEINFTGQSPLPPVTTVLNWLRSLPGHKGVKEGCAEGDCGACTVVLAETGPSGRLIYKTVDSCLLFLPMIHGKQLITIENLAQNRDNSPELHPVQQFLVDTNGTQCGYCTPGVVMSLFGLFKNHPNPSREHIEDGLTGNLCRCTGYQSILNAAAIIGRQTSSDHFRENEASVISMLHEINHETEPLELKAGIHTYFKPFTLEDALNIRKIHPGAIIINGSTDVSLRQTKKREVLSEILDLSAIHCLRDCKEEGSHYIVGAGVTLEQFKEFTQNRLPAFFKILEVFGSLQIRNVATLGGNVGSASPIGDMLPLMIVAGARIILKSSAHERILAIEDFITGYRKTCLQPDELITGIRIPKPSGGSMLFSHKISKRKHMDISTVSGALNLVLVEGVVAQCTVAFGGLDATPRRAWQTEEFLIKKPWNPDTILSAANIFEKEFTPISDARANASYRLRAGANLLMKFYLESTTPAGFTGKPLVGKNQKVISLDYPHDSAARHVTGESVFIEDMEDGARALFGKVICSPHAHALIKRIDCTAARQHTGVVSVLTAADIPGINQMGAVFHDEVCLASEKVEFIGQAVVLIAAETREAAHEAEKLVVIEYETLPAVLTIAGAMEKDNLLAPVRKIARGNVENALLNSPFTLQGELETGAQEHWYLETQTAMAVPGEGHEMKIHASSQNPAETQAIVAEVLGITKNEVEVEVKRIGGGFGGKETQGNHVAAWSALLANAARKPVKIHLFRDDDQIMTGKRHRFYSKYEIGFDQKGLILGYQVELNADGGYSSDLSRAIMERAMLHADNAYYVPHVSITGRIWKTNLPSNTAFRGFGGPQGMAVIENAIDRVARFLKKDAAEIRLLNYYQLHEKNLTPYLEKVENNNLFRIYDQLVSTSDYKNRRKKVDQFNGENRYFKKGLAMTPVKFGISFTTAFLNQAGALVNIYTDGTVQVNHGGTEMGQGLHTKILRIASESLGVSPSMVKVNATNTSRVPNASPTAASSGSDLNGMAVKAATEQIRERLAKVAATMLSGLHPGKEFIAERMVFENNQVYDLEFSNHLIPFDQLCNTARLQQVSLSSTGFYKTPGIYFDRETGQGNPFYYYAYGMAVSEVMVDLLTGEPTILRTDILHDAGDSISERIDIGQIEGGFIQGVGWCTTEEIKWDQSGNLITHSPDTYKIPTINDIPADFHVSLLQDAPNNLAVRRSKAVGEPPFMLALSVWLAIKDAVSSAGNHQQEPVLSLPATAEAILAAIEQLKVSAT